MKSNIKSAVHTFDTDFQAKDDPNSDEELDGSRCFSLIFLHAGCFGVIWVGWSWFAIWVAVFLYFTRMFAITAFLHRYFSHRSFKTSRPMQFLFAVAAGTAAQRGALWWAAHHRKHHKESDNETDVHSPHTHSFLWSHMGWITSPRNFATDYDVIKDFARFPELVYLNRFNKVVPLLLGVSLYFWETGRLADGLVWKPAAGKFWFGDSSSAPQYFFMAHKLSILWLTYMADDGLIQPITVRTTSGSR